MITPQITRREPIAKNQLQGLPILLQRLYSARGVRSHDELDYQLARLAPYQTLTGIDAATRVLADAIMAGQSIMMVGDFDTDGATSVALAIRALTAMGAQTVDYRVPNRFAFGYGLSPAMAEHVLQAKPDVVVTVDNGIASITGVEVLRGQGVKVIVTDHHLPGETLPAADAIVNPNQPGDRFPSKALAGVGVMFYVLIALRATLRERDWFDGAGPAAPAMAQWLDLVALGTVADVVPLDANNRILVEQGLRRMRAGRCVAGIAALAQVGKRELTRLVPADLGFAVAPRLNAAGRLEDISVGIECLLCDHTPRALELAGQLDALNRERREIESGMREQARALVAPLLNEVGESRRMGLCLYQPDWHEGIVGLVAGRIKEALHRPVIAFAPTREGTLKGSARSIAGLHIRDALAAVDARNPGLIMQFGGHAMAAGMTLEAAQREPFAEAFDAQVRHMLGDTPPTHEMVTDGPLTAQELTLETAELLRNAGPWGQGFVAPRFDGQFDVLAARVVGERHLKLQLRQTGETHAYDAIAFNTAADVAPEGARVQVVYRPDVNIWRGVANLQLIVEHIGAA